MNPGLGVGGRDLETTEVHFWDVGRKPSRSGAARRLKGTPAPPGAERRETRGPPRPPGEGWAGQHSRTPAPPSQLVGEGGAKGGRAADHAGSARAAWSTSGRRAACRREGRDRSGWEAPPPPPPIQNPLLVVPGFAVMLKKRKQSKTQLFLFFSCDVTYGGGGGDITHITLPSSFSLLSQ